MVTGDQPRPVAHAKDLLYCPILPSALLTTCQTYNPAPLCAITYERPRRLLLLAQ